MIWKAIFMGFWEVLGSIGVQVVIAIIGLIIAVVNNGSKIKEIYDIQKTNKDALSDEHKGLSAEHSNIKELLSKDLTEIKQLSQNAEKDSILMKERQAALARQDLDMVKTLEHVSAISTRLAELSLQNEKLREENRELKEILGIKKDLQAKMANPKPPAIPR